MVDKLNITIIDFLDKLKLNRFINDKNRIIREKMMEIIRIYNYLKKRFKLISIIFKTKFT